MRGINRLWLENEKVKDERIAWEMGYCVEVYRRRVAEEEKIEREING